MSEDCEDPAVEVAENPLHLGQHFPQSIALRKRISAVSMSTKGRVTVFVGSPRRWIKPFKDFRAPVFVICPPLSKRGCSTGLVAQRLRTASCEVTTRDWKNGHGSSAA